MHIKSYLRTIIYNMYIISNLTGKTAERKNESYKMKLNFKVVTNHKF